MRSEHADEWRHLPRFAQALDLPPDPPHVIDYSGPAGLRPAPRSAVTWQDLGVCFMSIAAITGALLGCSVACWYLFEFFVRRQEFGGDLLVMMFVTVSLLIWPSILHKLISTLLRGSGRRAHPAVGNDFSSENPRQLES